MTGNEGNTQRFGTVDLNALLWSKLKVTIIPIAPGSTQEEARKTALYEARYDQQVS